MSKPTRKESREMLLKAGEENFKPLIHNEFKCPVCGGIASVSVVTRIMRSECHSCGRFGEKYI